MASTPLLKFATLELLTPATPLPPVLELCAYTPVAEPLSASANAATPTPSVLPLSPQTPYAGPPEVAKAWPPTPTHCTLDPKTPVPLELALNPETPLLKPV